MQYLEGETLEHRLRKGALPIQEALTTAIQIADALDKAHRAGIVHRDLKPGNIMLTKGGAKLLDFGLAKTKARRWWQEPGCRMLPTTPPNLTAQGTIPRDVSSTAPEQLEGREADARTDIFAFGAVLHEMLAGKRHSRARARRGLIGAILEREPPPVSTLQPLTPPLLDHIVSRCLAKEPDGRWQSAADVTSELQWVAQHPSIPPGTTSPRPGRRERIAWITVAAALVVAGVGRDDVTRDRLRPKRSRSCFDVATPSTGFRLVRALARRSTACVLRQRRARAAALAPSARPDDAAAVEPEPRPAIHAGRRTAARSASSRTPS